MRVLQLMFFSADNIYQYKKNGNDHQLHNLYGFDKLNELGDYSVTCLSLNSSLKFFKSVPKLKRIILELRLIILQIKCAFLSRKFDVVYSPHDFHLLPLAILRMLRICRRPIFSISHFAYNMNYIEKPSTKIYRRIERFFVYKGIDRISFLNDNLLKIAIEGYNVPLRHRNSVNWGANLDFFQNYVSSILEQPNKKYFMSLGSQNRDYKILVESFSNTGLPLKIYSKKNISCEVPYNIVFDVSIAPGLDSVAKLRYYYYNAIAVLVPIIRTTDISNGASVIVEALAMGKPIIITDFRINYIDVEEEGIGFKIKPGDVNGWINATQWIVNNPEEAKEMGYRALELARVKYNYDIFVGNLCNQLNDLLKQKI